MKIIFSVLMGMFTLCLIAPAQGGNTVMTANEIIKKFDLQPLPGEGGYYRQTYKSSDPGIPASAYGIRANTLRQASTAIYYLVTPDSFSSLHRISSDEIFHFYAGDSVEMIQIDDEGNLSRIVIGSNFGAGEIPQVVVPKGVWQGTRLTKGAKWALMGTTVAPGFEFEDFEIGEREPMLKAFPQHSDDIIRYTKGAQIKASE